ncbi:hypothetical protein LCGC14_1991930 [marine sediment metagenome]|uniref:RNA ligase domain-containing protein n=1 Tax=marine sediment metagenome TaxID=412755 RepID=A0A0F9FTV9_9ZZZZ
MEFKKYQHIERFGTMKVEGIEFGTCYVFPKIDGTNGSAWPDGDGIRYGSRNRELTGDFDNSGFLAENITNQAICEFFMMHPNLRLFGEWLIPHSLKIYREDAWRKFYVFDVVRDLPKELPSGEKFEYLTYEEYQPLMEEFTIDYIPCIAKYNNGNYEAFLSCLKGNNFLVEDGKGDGEGIVIKNYAYKNKYGRTTWAKIVTSEFKEKHEKTMGPAEKSARIAAEEHIVEKYCTAALVEKVYSKIVAECEGWSSKFIPRLLNTVYYELVTEECWNFIKEYKNPIVNFKRLLQLIIVKIKQTKPELF